MARSISFRFGGRASSTGPWSPSTVAPSIKVSGSMPLPLDFDMVMPRSSVIVECR
jgi:hypothetical protein